MTSNFWLFPHLHKYKTINYHISINIKSPMLRFNKNLFFYNYICNMIFFIDSADLNEIKELNDLGIINGVTTNPSLMAKGIVGANSILEHYQEICNIVTGDVSAEVISTEYKDIIEEGHKLSEVDKKIVVKIPADKKWLESSALFF